MKRPTKFCEKAMGKRLERLTRNMDELESCMLEFLAHVKALPPGIFRKGKGRGQGIQ